MGSKACGACYVVSARIGDRLLRRWMRPLDPYHSITMLRSSCRQHRLGISWRIIGLRRDLKFCCAGAYIQYIRTQFCGSLLERRGIGASDTGT